MPRISKLARPKRAGVRKNGASTEADMPVPTVTHDDIARLAFELFERGGAEHGRDLQHWLEAERQLAQRQ
jgi:hypothetical protein